MQPYKPEGHSSVSPYLLVSSVRRQLDFLRATFGAIELQRMELPDGTIKHAEVLLDDSVIMMGERPDGRDPVPCSIHVYVPAVDVTYKAALAAGASSISEPESQPYGDRSAGVKDAEGNMWWLGTKL